MSRRVTYFNSSFTTAFHPLDLAGTQLYYAKNTATPSLWNDQSPNAFDLTQAVAGKQPTIGTDTVDFDGINDNQTAIVSSPFSPDTYGIVYFSGLLQTGVNSYFFTSARNTVNNTFFVIEIVSNAIRVIIRENSLTINNMILSTNTFASGYIYGYIKSNGSNYELMVNGIIQPFTMILGVDNGDWFAAAFGMTNISIGSLQRLSPVYRGSKVNKIYYNNTLLSASDITKLNTFFSDPNNY